MRKTIIFLSLLVTYNFISAESIFCIKKTKINSLRRAYIVNERKHTKHSFLLYADHIKTKSHYIIPLVSQRYLNKQKQGLQFVKRNNLIIKKEIA